MTKVYPNVQVSFYPEVLVEELGDEAVILDTKSERYFGLDDVALSFWQVLKKHGNTVGAVGEMAQMYDASEDKLHQDLGKLIVDLERAGLLKVLPTE